MKLSISGIRGEYGKDLSTIEVSRFARSFASKLMARGGSCIVSRDTRPSGNILKFSVIAALLEQGVNVYDLGIAPTPFTFRESRKYDGGIMITASHNPVSWNGLKFILKGRGISEEDLEGMLASEPPAPDTPGAIYQITTSYLNDVLDFVRNLSAPQKKHVGVDPGGGAACGYINELFHKLGHGFVAINDVYGISSRGTDPTIEDLNELRSLVVNNSLALGFAFDLDADRVVVVDKHGRKLDPDATLLLCVGAALDLGARKFVVSLDTSQALEKFIRNSGARIEYSKVGEANVVSKMIETGADAGGEGSSAGYISPHFNMCRDGFLASALIANMEEKQQAEYLKYAQTYEQIRSKIHVPNSLQNDMIRELAESLQKMASEIILLDGVKALLDENSWILVRISNTEDAMRISVESTRNNAHDLFEFIKDKVLTINEKVKGRADN
jgi:phosphomannomutase